MTFKPIIKQKRIYPKVFLKPMDKRHINDFIELEFKDKGVYINTCIDNAGNMFFLNYGIIEGVLHGSRKRDKKD